jgi:glycosyltransferase involved in cell wall biosynthesis
MPSDKEGLRVREIIKNCDNKFLPESKKIFTLSENVSSRLKKYNGIDSQPLYHPPDNAEKLYQGKYEDYVFFPSRISTLKRQDLAIEAMKYTKTDVKLILAGRPDNKYELKKIQGLISDNNLDSKVSLMLNISDEKKIKLFSDSLGSIFLPFDEDYGYVTLESFYSKKPVITTTDSGGPLEFVEDGKNGFISQPDPKELAKYLDLLFMEKQKSKTMGENGYNKIKAMKISWNTVVDSLIK